MKKVLFGLGLAAVAAFGVAQFSTPVEAKPPIDCSIVLCFPCPPGTVHAPLPGQCCRCIPPK